MNKLRQPQFLKKFLYNQEIHFQINVPYKGFDNSYNTHTNNNMKVKKKQNKEVNTYNLKVPPNLIAFLNIKKLQSLKSFSQTYTKKGNFNLQLTARNNFIKSYYSNCK